VPFMFESLEVWQLAMAHTEVIYKIADELPSRENFNLVSQIRRASTSVALNIAEGSTGQSDPEQSRFLGMAIRSLIETVACQKLIQRRQYLKDEALLDNAYAESQVLFRKLLAMRRVMSGGHSYVREDDSF